MDDKKTYEIFPGKTLSNLFNDIYNNSEKTGNQVGNLVDQLKTFVKSLDSAVVIVPLIREYLDVKVKSDELLVKLADTIQRLLRNDRVPVGGGFILSENEKKQLLEEVPTYEEIREKERRRLQKLGEQVELVKDELEQMVDQQKIKEQVEKEQQTEEVNENVKSQIKIEENNKV